MNPLDNNEECDFAKYFKNLGYEYSWDFSKRDGLHWHELYKNNKLILQIEMVPLKKIIEDMCVIEEIKTDYFIASSEDTINNYQELCQKVREFEKKK